ncbi:MAG TPA: PEGA domain-containing protein, partial [Methanoregulaceae archaeon]|nr:PEGA domain-containing protein [Methanoregulaceae archaeon]
TSGSVFIYSIPSNADVYLDSEFMGTTPLTLTNIEPGYHTLMVSKTGYRDYNKEFLIRDGEQKRLIVQLWSGGKIPFIAKSGGTDTLGDSSPQLTAVSAFDRLPESRLEKVLESGRL